MLPSSTPLGQTMLFSLQSERREGEAANRGATAHATAEERRFSAAFAG
jgi:hypothetical protein